MGDPVSLGEMISASAKFIKGEKLSPREQVAVDAYMALAKAACTIRHKPHSEENTTMAYEDWFAEVNRIFALMGYQEPVPDCDGWREYFGEDRTPAEAIADDMAHAT